MAFKSLLQFINHFQTDQACRSRLESVIWKDNPICPHCQTEHPYRLANGKHFKCRNKECRKMFTVTTNTVLQHSHINLPTWFAAIYLMVQHKKGISSLQLSKDLGITQKSAWFLSQRIRQMFLGEFEFDLEGIIEIDETYVGGKVKKKKGDTNKYQGRSTKKKIPVIGMVQRGGKVRTKVTQDTKKKTINLFIETFLKHRYTIMTDGWHGYRDVKNYHDHHVVDHGKFEYVRGIAHTNTIEGFWSILKRGIIGIYHKMTKKHLHRYCREFEFRYNTRKESAEDRFEMALEQCFGHLSYKELTREPSHAIA